jgi:SAM-dependent methyltransferase
MAGAAMVPHRLQTLDFDPGSYRDRDSRVFLRDGTVYRALSAAGLSEWEHVSGCRFWRQGLDEGRIAATSRVDCGDAECASAGGWSAVLEHESIPFVSYPYEWPFGMLRDAALLHLDLLDAALNEDVILKDATPFNVQFNGATPVFIDIGSFMRLPPGAAWVGYRQFCELFLYPLMLQAYRGVDFQAWLRGRIEGIRPAQFARLLSFRDWFRRGVLTHVLLHAGLERRFGDAEQRVPEALQSSGFRKELIQRNVRQLRRVVQGLRWMPRESNWSDYNRRAPHVAVDAGAKEAFVRDVVQSRDWDLVWDLGCNTGRYSRLAAERARCVVAMDGDHLTIERLYRDLQAEGASRIVPLVVNLADASPSLGWRGRERRDLPGRGRPDLTLCLALMHHLVIRENILLPELIEWLADLEGQVVIEFVSKSDPQVQSLLRHKTDQYEDYSEDVFEAELSARFDICRRMPLPSGTRTLYHAVLR